MRHVALIPVVIGALTLVGHTRQTAASDAQAPVFRSTASLVALNVTVTDGRRFVTGLQREDFAVFEDGVQQRVRFFEASDVPLDLILLIDTSSSMREQMNVVQSAAIGFINTLRDQDRAAVVAFGDAVQIAQGLTSDKAALQTAIHGTNAYGGTALHNAIYVALKEFGRKARDSSEVRRQAFAVLSDGQDTTSLLSFDDVLEQARRSGVTIYTINLRPDVEPPTPRLARQFSESEFGMRRLAQETGGRAIVAEHVNELHGIYSGLSEELSSQYSIGYAPTNSGSDGRFRRIVVRVTSRPGLRLRARTGYLAEGLGVAGDGPAGGR